MTTAMALLKAYSDSVMGCLEVRNESLPASLRNNATSGRTLANLRDIMTEQDGDGETDHQIEKAEKAANVERYRKQFAETGRLDYPEMNDYDLFEKQVEFVGELSKMGINIVTADDV